MRFRDFDNNDKLGKYVRIEAEQDSSDGERLGIFHACWGLLNNHILEPDDSDILLEVDSWFTEHLPKPLVLKRTEERADWKSWFKSSAADMLLHINPLIDLLEKYDVDYAVIYSDNPGTVIYEDEYQIVACDASS